MIEARQLGIDIKNQMKKLIEFSSTKACTEYQIPMYIYNMIEFSKIDFLHYRGITLDIVKDKIDLILGSGIYTGKLKNLYQIDVDNEAYKEISSWELRVEKCVRNVKLIIEPFLAKPPFYQSYW